VTIQLLSMMLDPTISTVAELLISPTV